MATNLDFSDVRHSGQHRFDNVILPADSVGNLQYSSADPLSLTNQLHQHSKTFGQAHGTAATNERRVLHVARGAGVVLAVQAGVVVQAVGNSTVTVDVLKNGTTVLTGVITLNSTHTAYTEVPGVLNAAADDYVSGDVFEFVLVAAVGTGTLPQAVYLDVVFSEAAA